MGGAHSWHNSWYQKQLQGTQKKMLRQEKQRSATQEANEIATDSLRRRGEAKSPGTGNSARQHSGLFFSNPAVPGQEKKGGWGAHSPLKPLPPPCLPTFSEPPCHRTSSSWKLPLGSALRMPNSISQGACQQPGWGLRNTATAIGAAPGHPALPLPTLWFPESCRTVP